MFFNCTKILRVHKRPPAKRSNPIIRRARPSMPKCCTVDRSGSFRLASPPPACSCAPASVGSSRPIIETRTAATVLDFRFKKATTSASALTARKKYTEYCAVTFPPKQMFVSESRTAPEHTTSQNCGEKPREGYHPHLAVSRSEEHT